MFFLHRTFYYELKLETKQNNKREREREKNNQANISHINNAKKLQTTRQNYT